MALQFVTPYVKTNKNYAADAEAIYEAVTLPNIRFVAVRTGAAAGFAGDPPSSAETQQGEDGPDNQIRGFLAEIGIVIPQELCNLHPEWA
jgi:transposase